MTNPQPHLPNPKYRPDIDGLRAIAVLAVVAFHAFPNSVKGGFIGVDVFFVISGYLISTIIYESLDKGTFSFREFYARRIRRIFPALILVLVACFAFGWFALLADEYKQLGRYIVSGAGFISNLALWGDAGYFDNATETKPLLHLWSLGIEEQFYIIWPIILWLAWNLNFPLLLITVIATLISFSLNIKGVTQDAVATFYSPQTRFWELFSGCLLAWFSVYKKQLYQSPRLKSNRILTAILYPGKTVVTETVLANMLSTAGIMLLTYGFWHINRDSEFPGKLALIPIVGSLLIIEAGPKASINQLFLSHKITVWFGLISFPLYLWHWPLLSFARVLEGEIPSWEIRISIVLISIILAWMTYMIIERPIRLGANTRGKVFILSIAMLSIGCIGYATYSSDGFKFRKAQKINEINSFELSYREVCDHTTNEDYFDDWCNNGTGIENTPSVAMIGDSFSNAFSPMLKFYSNYMDPEFRFIQFGRGQCPSLIDYGPEYCHLITQKSIDFIKKSNSINTVILASNWPAYYNGKNFTWVKHTEDAATFRSSLEKTISTLQALNKNIVVFLAPPTGSDPKSCIVRQVRLTDNNNCNLSLEKARSNDGDYRSYIIPLLERMGIQYFDPFDVFCDDAKCMIISNDGKVFYADERHMSVFGGEYLAEKGKLQLRNVLAPLPRNWYRSKLE